MNQEIIYLNSSTDNKSCEEEENTSTKYKICRISDTKCGGNKIKRLKDFFHFGL